MHASQRGHLLRKLGDLIARDAEKLAAIEVQDNGKLISEMAGQLKYTPQWYYYYGGLADKIEPRVALRQRLPQRRRRHNASIRPSRRLPPRG